MFPSTLPSDWPVSAVASITFCPLTVEIRWCNYFDFPSVACSGVSSDETVKQSRLEQKSKFSETLTHVSSEHKDAFVFSSNLGWTQRCDVESISTNHTIGPVFETCSKVKFNNAHQSTQGSSSCVIIVTLSWLCWQNTLSFGSESQPSHHIQQDFKSFSFVPSRSYVTTCVTWSQCES